MQPAQFLKTLVIVLGVAIVIALGFVVYGVVRLGAKSETASVSSAPLALPTVSDLGQPSGTEIVAVTISGPSRLILTLKGGARPDRIVVVDINSGKLVSTTYASPMAPE
jgi:hypothetical protein